MDRVGIITMREKPLTLVGMDVKERDRAPGFTVLDGNLAEVRLEDFKGKMKVISVTPSLPHDVEVLNISMDLPFAISRFCTAAEIERVRALSDHRDASFGNAYGVLIKELRLLARSIFIVDKHDVVRYLEIVTEQANHPDYDRALAVLNRLLGLAKLAQRSDGKSKDSGE